MPNKCPEQGCDALFTFQNKLLAQFSGSGLIANFKGHGKPIEEINKVMIESPKKDSTPLRDGVTLTYIKSAREGSERECE